MWKRKEKWKSKKKNVFDCSIFADDKINIWFSLRLRRVFVVFLFILAFSLCDFSRATFSLLNFFPFTNFFLIICLLLHFKYITLYTAYMYCCTYTYYLLFLLFMYWCRGLLYNFKPLASSREKRKHFLFCSISIPMFSCQLV